MVDAGSAPFGEARLVLLAIIAVQRFGLGLDLHFAFLVSVLQSVFMQLLSACGEGGELMLYFIGFHWMRRCDGFCVGQQGGCRAELGWRSRAGASEAAGEAGAAEVRGCSECVQCAQWTLMLTLMLGGGLDFQTRV